MEKYYYRLIIMVALALTAMNVSAADVDVATAESLASKFMKSRVRGKFLSSNATLRLSHVEKSSSDAAVADYYVFNSSNGGSFVIIAGDDRAEQVLGYGDGTFDMATIPANVRWWLGEYKRQIEYLRTVEQADARPAPRQVRAPSRIAPVAPLLTSTWSQDEPYCNQCPEYQGVLSATGCIATALAQVMYYWKYPAELPALPAYVTISKAINVPALPGTQLDWDNMLDSYSRGRYTYEQGEAVATLMRYCGQACYMDYTPEASAAWEEDQLGALKRFGYNPDGVCIYRDDMDDDKWEELLQKDLSEGHPVLYTGNSMESGHAFVLDGYADGKYHVNWGWGGSHDGYFALDAMGTSNVYGSFEFNYNQRMLYGVYPVEDGASIARYDFEQDGIYYLKQGNEVTVTQRDHNYNCYSGAVNIPATVTHDGETYRVTTIGHDAFRDCDKVTSVTIPSSVTRIENTAFRNCISLSYIHFGSNIKSVGKSAFMGCRVLETVEVDDLIGWCSIDFEDYASSPLTYAKHFILGGREVRDLVIPREAGKVGDYTFMYAMCFDSITIEDGVTEIGESAFAFCENLKRVTIPGSVTKVGDMAFMYCYDLTTVNLAEGVGSIGDYAFYDCESLEQISIPGSVKRIGMAAFLYCLQLRDLTLAEGLEVIDEAAFYNCEALAALTVPSSVQFIGYAAFAYCSNNKQVIFNGDNLELDDFVFYDNMAMEQLELPHSLTAIGEATFCGCRSLSAVTIPSAMKRVGPAAFAGCGNLQRVDIAGLKSWLGISFLDGDANPLTIAHHLYVGGEEVTEVVIPAGVETIGKCAFSGGSSLTGVTFPSSVKSLGESAFKGCTSLQRVNAADVKSWFTISFTNDLSNPLNFARHLYVGGEEVNNVTVPSGVTRISDYAMVNCESVTALTVPDEVTSIGNNAFYCCGNLAAVTVGDGVKTIGDRAFSTCTSLGTVSLGTGLELLGSRVFSSSMQISSITVKAMLPPKMTSKDAFASSVYKKATLKVPQEALDDYRSTQYWSNFANCEAIVSNVLLGDVNLDGEITISDVNAEIQAMYSGNDCEPLFDINGDGEINIADVNAIIDLIMSR